MGYFDTYHVKTKNTKQNGCSLSIPTLYSTYLLVFQSKKLITTVCIYSHAYTLITGWVSCI